LRVLALTQPSSTRRLLLEREVPTLAYDPSDPRLMAGIERER
jgi:hypothetical protein